MRRFINVLFVLSLLVSSGLALAGENAVVVPAPSLPEPRSLNLDLKESHVRWVGKNVTGQHNGTIQIKSGEVQTKGETLTGGRFEIDMTSIVVEDLTKPKDNTKLTNLLKSDNFFAVVKYPTAVFQVKEAKPGAQGSYDMTGDLTIKGITNLISFPLKMEIAGAKARATGTATIDRTKWDIRYGSGKFFKNLGNKLIDDNFEITFDVAAEIPSNR
jgi:polyisoprenoid-binding protein YceI